MYRSVAMGRLPRRRTAGAVIAVGLVLALSLTATSSGSPAKAAASKKFVIGVSNTVVGNPIRDEQLCMIKAQARASGRVSSVKLISENTSAAGQVAQVRDLLSAGVDAVLMDPADPNALNSVIAQGQKQGIVMVAFDQDVTSPVAYQAYNNQYLYGKLGMEALAKQLGGHGNVVELRGAAGAPADTARHNGVLAALREYPNVHLVKSVYTSWDFATAGTDMLNLLNSNITINGVWTSGVDVTTVNAFATAHKPYVPVVGADTNGFIKQAITLKSKGFVGIVVTNPLATSAIGLDVALHKLEGKSPPRVTEVTPQVFSSANSAGLHKLKQLYNPAAPSIYGDLTQIAPYTNYTNKQLLACSGP